MGPGGTPPVGDAPPPGVLGVLIPKQEILTRTRDAVIALTCLRVHEEGCVLELVAAARRGDRPYETWFGRTDAQAGALFAPVPGRTDPAAVRVRVAHAGADPGTPPLLRGSAGTSTPDLLELTLRFWLSPNPPPTPFDLVVEWPAAGIAPHRHPIDGGEIAEAARRVQRFW
ncbi:hypothetical protein [Actinokineospora spheciospongiae]|nr:hypothetical protein [Actinokineospora spheciospongiae]